MQKGVSGFNPILPSLYLPISPYGKIAVNVTLNIVFAKTSLIKLKTIF